MGSRFWFSENYEVVVVGHGTNRVSTTSYLRTVCLVIYLQFHNFTEKWKSCKKLNAKMCATGECSYFREQLNTFEIYLGDDK